MMHKKLLTAAIVLFSSLALTAQTVKVRGVVLDDTGAPLTGAYVLIKGTTTGTSADIDGNFTLDAKPGQTLEFQFMGYETLSLTVPENGKKLEVHMLPDSNNVLQEAVTIAYGTVRKEDLTGSVTNVKMGDIREAPVASVDQALQGRIAGADIMSTSGEPGSSTTIRIRGTRSVNASNEPLIVVDGVMDAVSDLGDLNPSDIESMTVLKDASSTAIYGSRGSNGVIIVTTKNGDSGTSKPRISFKAEMGFAQLPRGLDLMNATEYAEYRNDIAFFSSDSSTAGSGSLQESYPYPDPISKGEGTDWIKAITRTALQQNYNLSLAGGDKKTSYYASFGYNDTKGIIKNSGQSRYSGRLNLDRQLFKWIKVGYKGAYTYRKQDRNLADIGGTSTRSAIYLSPLRKLYDSIDDDYDNVTYNPPTMQILLNTYQTTRISMNHSMYAEVSPLENLVFRSQNTYYGYQEHWYRYYPSTLPAKRDGQGGDAYRREYDSITLSTENTLTYKWKWGRHNLDALAGWTAQAFTSNDLSLSGSGYMEDAVQWNNMGSVIDKNTLSPNTSKASTKRVSFLARVNWNYRKRYYLTVTGRYDGASNFAANNKWAFFPSAALKWNMKNEKWLKNVNWIDELSLRASAGRTGNDAVSAYQSIEKLSSTYAYLFGGSQPVAYVRTQLASPDLTWEKTDLFNIATDLSFLNNRINITAELYTSRTTDLLLDVSVGAASGFTSHFQNLGATSNKGFELSVETRNIVKPKWGWTTNFTFSRNRQMVEDIGTTAFVDLFKSGGNNGYMMNGFVKGYPLNALWGFRYAGIWKDVDAEVERNEATHAYASALSPRAGLPKYHDIDHDGILSQDDLVYLGNADPDFYGGLQNTFNYKNLKLSVYFTYSLGGKIYNYSELYMAGGSKTNQWRKMINRWHPVRNPDGDLPGAGVMNTMDVPSDRMVYDASFLRLKNVSLSYTFDLAKKVNWLRDITVSASADNLFLWKKYPGFDPDVSSSGSSSTLRRMDLGAYPKPITVMFSIQVRY